MSGQSEAERLNANVITHGQESADWVAWARGEIRALQAQVEQLEERAEFNDGLYENLAEERDAALRQVGQGARREAALQEAMRLIAVKYGNESNLRAWVPAKAILDALIDRAPSEQSESDR